MAVSFDAVLNLSKAGLINPEQMGYKDSLEIIKDESVKIQKSFVKVGWYLKHIRDDELYKEDGYANINECAADQLGYTQSTVSRLINICEKFSKNHNSPELDEKYAGFDKSQMIEMLPMNEKQMEKVKPDMTVKQIRDIKDEGKTSRDDEESDEDSTIPGQISIEKDFPEYMPSAPTAYNYSDVQDASKEYATLHKDRTTQEYEESIPDEAVMEGGYREIDISETMVCELEEIQEKEDIVAEKQQELPMLKNDVQRKQWLNDYKAWGLWYRDDNIDVNYYKFDFIDGSRLVVAEYPQRHSYYSREVRDETFYHLIPKNKVTHGEAYDEEYRHATHSETELLEFLKNLQKKCLKKTCKNCYAAQTGKHPLSGNP